VKAKIDDFLNYRKSRGYVEEIDADESYSGSITDISFSDNLLRSRNQSEKVSSESSTNDNQPVYNKDHSKYYDNDETIVQDASNDSEDAKQSSSMQVIPSKYSVKPFLSPPRHRLSPEEWDKVVSKYIRKPVTNLDKEKDIFLSRMETFSWADAKYEHELYSFQRTRFDYLLFSTMRLFIVCYL
jgi:hypothetical protein